MTSVPSRSEKVNCRCVTVYQNVFSNQSYVRVVELDIFCNMLRHVQRGDRILVHDLATLEINIDISMERKFNTI